MVVAARVAPVELWVEPRELWTATGGSVDAAVGCRAGDDIRATGIEAALVARIAYRARHVGLIGAASATRAVRSEVHAKHHIPGPWPLAAGESVRLPVRLALPDAALGSARSELVEVSWWVRVRLQAAGHATAELRHPIDVLSPAGDRAFVAMAPPTAADRGLAALSFEGLSTRVLEPGRPISGVLVVTARRQLPAAEAKVRLVLRQLVTRGYWAGEDPARHPQFLDNERDTTVAVAALVQQPLAPGQPVRMPFRLPELSSLPAPSMLAPPFRISWVLRAELDRGLRRTPMVELELHGRTARA